MTQHFAIQIHNSWEKLTELITYVARRHEGHERFGLLKLAKVLFFSDFTAFQRLGQPITGAGYRKFPNGPLPTDMYAAIRDADHLSVEDDAVGEYTQSVVRSTREARAEVFSPEELQIVDEFIREFWSMTARELSDLSHGIPWSMTPDRDYIPYEAAYLGQPGHVPPGMLEMALAASREA